MPKHGNKYAMTVNVSEEAALAIEGLQERFGVTASAVVEVCVLAERKNITQIEKVLGVEGFEKVLKLLRWWAARPAPFEGWAGELEEVK